MAKPTNNSIDNNVIDSGVHTTSSILSSYLAPLGQNDIYLVAYQDITQASDGYVKTFKINSLGDINETQIDILEFDTLFADMISMTQVNSSIFAVTYQGDAGDGFVRTFSVDSVGNISNATIDSLEFDTADCSYPTILPVTGAIYAVSYQGQGADGFMKTFSIDSAGNISNATLGVLEFDASNGQYPGMTKADANTFIVAYRGASNRGYAKSIDINPAGTAITLKDSVEFSTPGVAQVNVTHAIGDIYVISHEDLPSNNGYLITFSSNADGNMSDAMLASLEFNSTDSGSPSMIKFSEGIVAIAYEGTANIGVVELRQIFSNGAIGNSPIDTLTYETGLGLEPHLIQVAEGIYAIAYTGPTNYGKTITFGMASGNSGVFKENSYGLMATVDSAFAFINGTEIYAPISSEWVHLALTYNKDSSAPQQRLYVNGVQTAGASSTSQINLNDNNFVIGKKYSGSIDETVLYNRVLTSAEIKARYDSAFRGTFFANELDSGVAGSTWIRVFVTADVNSQTSCIDLNYGAAETSPATVDSFQSCITPNSWVSLNKIGRYLDFSATLRNSTGGNWVKRIYINDFNFEENH